MLECDERKDETVAQGGEGEVERLISAGAEQESL